MKISAIIPARYGSTRFPGKALADLYGRPLILHVLSGVMRSRLVNEVFIATDDERILKAVEGSGGIGVMTSSLHKSGTDRAAEVSEKLDSDIIVNVQGDEPLIEPEVVDFALSSFIERRDVLMGTIKTEIKESEEIQNPNVVKVVTDKEDNALYFSRSPIPYNRDEWNGFNLKNSCYGFKHIGLYVYRQDFLLKFSKLGQGKLEKIEKLEQLRALENGYKIYAPTTEYNSIGVDTPNDLELVKKIISCKG